MDNDDVIDVDAVSIDQMVMILSNNTTLPILGFMDDEGEPCDADSALIAQSDMDEDGNCWVVYVDEMPRVRFH
jgi:hypothetical protein